MPRTVNCRRFQLRQRAWMHSQIDRGFVLSLARLACHAGPPGRHTRTVAAPRQEGIGSVLGLSGRTKDLNPFAVRPLDIFSAAKTAIGEIAPRQMAA
ncbi:hypothetical protein RPHASCH2410_PA01685 (plasmid) [Rhizobium phaseoli Ch24-10]|nr:hypothetical protein RPHASCH2410_PA01685 [Rhizobium phaseoli Ch24-10]